MLKDMIPSTPLSTAGITRYRFRSNNRADIIEIELDVKPPTTDFHKYTLSMKVGIFEPLIFEFLSDKIFY